MRNVLAELCQWASSLPYWEQAAFSKIITGVSFNDAEYDELFRYLLEDANLLQRTGNRTPLSFSQYSNVGSQPITPIQLNKITNLQNVNALVQGQTLSFGTALTAIYGGNGSGKSGYARVLGCAGFTRGDQEVFPDVTRPNSNQSPVLSADIEINEGNSSRIIHYRIGSRCPELSSFYIFDSTSVRVHLTGSNSLSFSPFGLSYLTQLAEITDEVRRRLDVKIEEDSKPHCFDTLFQGDSDVKDLITNLGTDSDLAGLKQISIENLSSQRQQQIQQLDLQIAHLKAQDPSKEMEIIKQKILDLENLTKSINKATEGLNDTVMLSIQDMLHAYTEQRIVAQRMSVDQFKSEYFTKTGSELWYQFVEAAKSLADIEQTPDEPYPQLHSHCLLCYQPLSEQARDLLTRLWVFLEGDAQAKLDQIQQKIKDKRKGIEAIELDFFDEHSVSFRYFQETNPVLSAKIQKFVTVCHKRRESIYRSIGAYVVDTNFPSLVENGIPEIAQQIAGLQRKYRELQEKDTAKEISKLEQQMRNLQHRELLCQYFPQIEDYVKKRIWAKRANKIGGNTRHITQKHNELFKELVTDRYIELFEKMLNDLKRPIKVKVATKGRKGEVYKQIVLQADPSTPINIATPDKVLSEGEKRAVALADFLTEVALDMTSSGIILDDPVTSLDLEWRDLIASILITEAKRRQVIVFTHDLPFLYFLKKYSEQESVTIETHWIKRGGDNKPGYVFLNNSPALEREYRKTKQAREIYTKAKNLPATEQEILLKEGFGALRTTYEAFIIFELFNEVVMRFDERISFGRLEGIAWDKSIVNEVIAKCELLSKYIEGHLHSDAFAARKPEPADLLREIEEFEKLQKKLKELKKTA